MTDASESNSDASHRGVPGEAHGESVFMTRFSEEERQSLLLEDRAAQLGVSMILSVLICIGMLLGIFGVLLISYLGI